MPHMRGKWILAVVPIILMVACGSSGGGVVGSMITPTATASASPTADTGDLLLVEKAVPTCLADISICQKLTIQLRSLCDAGNTDTSSFPAAEQPQILHAFEALCPGNVTQPTPSPTPTDVFAVAQPANLELTTTNRLDGSTTDSNVAITVQSVSTPSVSVDGLGDTPQNGLFIVVSVHFQVTSGSLDYNPFNFQLQLADGTVFQPDNGNAVEAGVNPMLDDGSLTTGQQVAGYIVFDANAPHGTINYKPGDDIFASWKY